MRVLSQDEINKLLALEPAKLSLRNWVMIRMFLWTGLRVSELTGLNIEDVYFVKEPKKFLVVRPEIAKGGNGREIPISEKLRDALRTYYSDISLSAGPFALNPDRPLFTQHRQTNKRLTCRQVQRIVGLAGREIGRPDLHPHEFRHTFATSLLRATNIRTVQTILGHKSLTSTQIYTHPTTEDMAVAVNKL